MTVEHHELLYWESVELLRASKVGRLCILEAEYPVAVPVNYRLVDSDASHAIVVRTAPTTMLARYEGPASLEVDEIDLDGGTAWSVIARGRLHRLVGEHSLPDPEPIISIDRLQWMMLSITAVSGRRFTVQSASDGFSVEWQVS
jgi:hypothetical protein